MSTASVAVTELRLKFPGSPKLLFEDLSLSVPAGQKVLLLGPSGCGKSTLLQVLSGLIPGSIEVPMKAEGLQLPESWGYLFQDPDAQFCMPYVDEEIAFVLENLCVPRAEMPERIRRCLAQVGLNLGDNPHVPIASLSQGMKQRLAIASLLALEPEVWFLDEPTSLLDPEGTTEVWDTVKQVTADKTVLIVEHKIDEIVDFVNRVVLFGPDARVLADGEPQQVFHDHKPELEAYGIWYPGVWDDYAARAAVGAAGRVPSGVVAAQPLVQLGGFTGFHGRTPKIEVPEAELYAGDWIAVVGENGAGKSTLLQSLMQLLPTAGEYAMPLLKRIVRGFDDVADVTAYVFQNPEMQFVAGTVYDELAFNFRRDGVPEREVQAKTEELLVWFGLTDHRSLHPYQLSLGQKRRLSVAAATVKAQRLVLLDEPTFGQDAANTFALLEKLEAWRQQGSAIVMVTHDPEIVARFATRVWEVRSGRLADVMSPGEYVERLEAAKPMKREPIAASIASLEETRR
ncbi:ABC transporter ATP-binding protein [Paenibacillus cremeus]|uniref:ABC transporter ATP-binding protein n=1 Tax=Paenibacillus cremeus TaxID=2163881 RepID=A0A559K9Y0_9BACL|nr:ABC transporter ATP-binding protein [Paenibacillus cremeus]TVY08940.1 ABC transporter ATP-binding protein [Paenibacillus cremeus]